MRTLVIVLIALALSAASACNKTPDESPFSPLMFEVDSGNFFFMDSSGNRVIYERAENTLIVEPDINIEQLAQAFCAAERATAEPALFASVGLVLAEGVVPFIETVESVCDR